MRKLEKIKLRTPSSKIKQLADQYRKDDVCIEEIIYEVVEVCAAQLERHANELEAFEFYDKARTARSCAGIIREEYELPHTLPKR